MESVSDVANNTQNNTMTRQDIYDLIKGLPKERTSRSIIELTNLNTGVTDTFNVPTLSVKSKLGMMSGWTEEKLEKVSIKIG